MATSSQPNPLSEEEQAFWAAERQRASEAHVVTYMELSSVADAETLEEEDENIARAMRTIADDIISEIEG